MVAETLPSDLDLLFALDVMLRERHVTRAAARLGITQGAASQRLARLREYFGDPLLVPGRPLLALTPRAQAVAGPLARALAELRAAVAAGTAFEPARSERRFVILGNDLAEAYALPALLAMVAIEAPNVGFSFERADESFGARLEQGTADLAFLPEFMVHGSLRKRSLPAVPFIVLLRRGHPALRTRLTLERYLSLGHVLIAPRGLPGSVVDDALAARGKSRRVVARLQHFVTAPFVVAGSDLALTCPATVLDAMRGVLPLASAPAPLELGVDRTCAAWHERAHADPGLVWLRSLLDRFVRDPERTMASLKLEARKRRR